MIPDMVSDADGIPSVVKAVYSVGQIYLSFDRNSTKATGGGRTYRPKIQKHDSADVYTNIFLPSSSKEFYGGISGLLYSASSFKSSLYLSTMSSTFVYVHNFVADNPIPQCSFGEKMDFWIEEGNGEYLLKNNGKAN